MGKLTKDMDSFNKVMDNILTVLAVCVVLYLTWVFVMVDVDVTSHNFTAPIVLEERTDINCGE